MLKSPRSRLVAVLAAAVLAVAGVVVPIGVANAAVAYPAQAPGTLALEISGTTQLEATTSGFPAGTSVSDPTWYRGSTRVPGYFGNVYQLTEADSGKTLRFRVTVSVPGFAPTQRLSAPQTPSLTRSGYLSIAGAPQVGGELTATDTTTFTKIWPGSVFPFRSYYWKVNGAEVAYSSTPDPLPILPAYFGKKITLEEVVVDGNMGSAPLRFISNAITITQRPPIPHTAAEVTVSKTVNPNGTITLTATPSATISEPGVSGPTLQWYRADVTFGTTITPITGKTGPTYTLTSADYPYRVFVRATWKKTGFDPLVADSFKKDYSVRATGRVVAGSLVVGGAANGVNDFSFELPGDTDDRDYVPSHGTVVYKWYRSGTLVPGQTDYIYPITSADRGKTLQYAVTVSKAGYLTGSNLKSASSPKIGYGALNFSGLGMPEFTVDPVTMKATVAPTGATFPASTVTKVQWRRNGIVVYTGATYQLTSADYGTAISVLMTYSAPGYTSGTAASQDWKPWVKPSPPAPVIEGTQEVGEWLNPAARIFTNADTGSALPTSGMTYQWYRNGVAISAAEHGKDESYQLLPADAGKTITLKVTMPSTGLLPSIATSAPVGPIGDQELDGAHASLGISVLGSGSLMAATGVTGPAGFSVKFQWYRDSTPITGKTTAFYTLTTADRGHVIWARVTTSHAPAGGVTYTTAVQETPKIDFSLAVANARFGPSGFSPTPGTELQVDADVTDFTGTCIGCTSSVAWLRNGKPIAGAQGVPTYVLKTTDVGATITARVTYSRQGRVPLTVSVGNPPVVVQKGVFDATGVTPLIEPDAIGTVKATVPSGVSPDPTSYRYQWYRGGSAISGSTTSKYKLVAADAGKPLTVRVTAARTGFVSAVLPLSATYSPDIEASGPVTLPSGTPQVGDALSMTLPSYSTEAGLATPFVAYRWLRNGVVISGQSTNGYTLRAADIGASIQGQAVITLEGRLARTDTSAGTFPVEPGTIEGSFGAAITSPSTGVLHAELQPGAGATEGVTALSYAWYRENTGAKIASTQNYTLTPADDGVAVWVRITLGKPGYGTEVDAVQQIGNQLTPSGTPVLSGGGGVLYVQDPQITFSGPGAASPTLQYRWFKDGVLIDETATFHPLGPGDTGGHTFSVEVRGVSTGYYSAGVSTNTISL